MNNEHKIVQQVYAAKENIQAADQLEGTGITLFKMGEPEVPTVHEFLKKCVLPNQHQTGFDCNQQERSELSACWESSL